jgi:hypothetical protein
LLPGLTAGGERLVIDKAAFLKHSVEDALLSLCRIDSVFVRFTHTVILALFCVTSKRVLYRLWAKAWRFHPVAEACGLLRQKASTRNVHAFSRTTWTLERTTRTYMRSKKEYS